MTRGSLEGGVTHPYDTGILDASLKMSVPEPPESKVAQHDTEPEVVESKGESAEYRAPFKFAEFAVSSSRMPPEYNVDNNIFRCSSCGSAKPNKHAASSTTEADIYRSPPAFEVSEGVYSPYCQSHG